jgi:hypothetical protein
MSSISVLLRIEQFSRPCYRGAFSLFSGAKEGDGAADGGQNLHPLRPRWLCGKNDRLSRPSNLDDRSASVKTNRKAKKNLMATTPKSKIAATPSSKRRSQKLIATKMPLLVRQTFACVNQAKGVELQHR